MIRVNYSAQHVAQNTDRTQDRTRLLRSSPPASSTEPLDSRGSGMLFFIVLLVLSSLRVQVCLPHFYFHIVLDAFPHAVLHTRDDFNSVILCRVNVTSFT
jgi:hypothetical protein